jgi:3-phenylpropionate/trans-cinnamate dioxygenase ferredoxin subunit
MSFRPVCKISDLEGNRLHPFRIGQERIAIIKSGDEIYAISDICTHDGNTLSGGVIEDGCAVCPRHGAWFDLRTGRAVRLPATEGIDTFKTRIVGESVEVDLPED